MPSILAATRSSIGKKLLSGLTGLLLCGFIVAHLIGNLLLLVSAEAFNEYAHLLESLGHGYFIYVAEAGLIAIFLAHAVSGIQVALDRRRAREGRYSVRADAGGASQKTLASRSMIITGIVLAIFVPVHVWMFKYGPGLEEGYATTVDGEPFRDLHLLVVEWFKDPLVVVAYVAVMLLLGMHLRHGFWSAFQSLGANSPRAMPVLRTAGVAFAVLMALGFLMLPVIIFFFVEPDAGARLITG